MTNDTWTLGGHKFHSRFILGSGKYSLDLIKAAVEQAGAEILTLALRRANSGALANILDYVPENVTLLPNTSGARNAEEAVRIARLARELCHTDFVKIEVIKDSKYLLPDNHETLKATEILAKEGFIVMPYMYPDLQSARDMRDVGAACIMPLGAPIGSNKGLCTKDFIQIRRRHRQAFTSLRSYGNGCSGNHGEHRDCQRRQPAAHGQCLPRCNQRRPQGLSRRLRQCPRHCQRKLPADRLSA